MRHRDFCYWLQGFNEVQKPENGLTKEQWEEVKTHLALCFNYENNYQRVILNDSKPWDDLLRYSWPPASC